MVGSSFRKMQVALVASEDLFRGFWPSKVFHHGRVTQEFFQ
jgi:hypothetical protein